MSNPLAPLAALSLVMLVSACATADTGPTPTPRITDSPTASPTSSGSPTPTPDPTARATPTDAPSGAVVVTLRVADTEEYRILLTDPEDIATARALLNGERQPLIPIGPVVREPSPYNPGYDWHIDPDEFEWVEISMELCDGQPSMVSEGWESDVYCPWGAEVVAVDEVN